MIEELGVKLISNYGFPIFISLWLLFRTERIINQNTEAINQLAKAMEVNNGRRRRE